MNPHVLGQLAGMQKLSFFDMPEPPPDYDFDAALRQLGYKDVEAAKEQIKRQLPFYAKRYPQFFEKKPSIVGRQASTLQPGIVGRVLQKLKKHKILTALGLAGLGGAAYGTHRLLRKDT